MGRIPHFKTLEEVREFWQTHSVADYLDELTPVKVAGTRPRKQSISVKLTLLEARVLHVVLARLFPSRSRQTSSAHRNG